MKKLIIPLFLTSVFYAGNASAVTANCYHGSPEPQPLPFTLLCTYSWTIVESTLYNRALDYTGMYPIASPETPTLFIWSTTPVNPVWVWLGTHSTGVYAAEGFIRLADLFWVGFEPDITIGPGKGDYFEFFFSTSVP
jgi:hypothetical protein